MRGLAGLTVGINEVARVAVIVDHHDLVAHRDGVGVADARAVVRAVVTLRVDWLSVAVVGLFVDHDLARRDVAHVVARFEVAEVLPGLAVVFAEGAGQAHAVVAGPHLVGVGLVPDA